MGACGTDLCTVHSLRCFQLSQRAGLGVCILNERLYYQPLPPPPELLWLGGPRAMRADPDELKAAVFLPPSPSLSSSRDQARPSCHTDCGVLLPGNIAAFRSKHHIPLAGVRGLASGGGHKGEPGISAAQPPSAARDQTVSLLTLKAPSLQTMLWIACTQGTRETQMGVTISKRSSVMAGEREMIFFFSL